MTQKYPEIVSPDNSFKADSSADWKLSGKAVFTDDNILSFDHSACGKTSSQACLKLTLNQAKPAQVILSAESSAECAETNNAYEYAVLQKIEFIDGSTNKLTWTTFNDGTLFYSDYTPFTQGSHCWEKRVFPLYYHKAIRSVELNVNFLNATGKSLFRNITVTDYAANDAAVFDTFPVSVPADFPADGLFIRMADNGTNFVPLTENPMPGVSAVCSSEKKGNAVFHKVHFTSADNADHVFTVYGLKPLPRDGENTPVYLQDLLHTELIDDKKDYLDVSYWNVGANGLFSRFPITAASCGEKGFAMGFAPVCAAFCRAGCSGTFQAIYAAADLALTPEKPETDFCFITFEFDGTKGFRGALHNYYGMFPEYYATTIHDQGNWMAFVDISTLPDYQDFGFKFKEGNTEPAWDRQHDIYTFRYTEPMTGWMNTDRTPVNRADVFNMLAERKEKQPDGIAKIVETSSMHDVDGNDIEIAMDKPWCHGAVWSINSMPGIPSPDSDFNRKWNNALLKEWYTPGTEKELSGEYIDSCEGYVTAEISHRRDHFAYTSQPLTFSKDSWKPGIFKGAIALEYIRAIRKDMHGIGKYTMANGQPDKMWFLPPLLDVCGTETDWVMDKQWQPPTADELYYRRSTNAAKPYCFLMNTNFDYFTHEMVEKYMKWCGFFGMFPSFFSANAATGHYFRTPELYERDRPLFKKYMPIIKRVAESGWECITNASCDSPDIFVERFGDSYITVLNHGLKDAEFTVSFDLPCDEIITDEFTGGQYPVKDGKCAFRLAGHDVMILRLHR